MSTGGTSASVLGASTSIISGVAVLPHTGTNSVDSLLSYLAIIMGTLVLFCLLSTRLLKTVLK